MWERLPVCKRHSILFIFKQYVCIREFGISSLTLRQTVSMFIPCFGQVLAQNHLQVWLVQDDQTRCLRLWFHDQSSRGSISSILLFLSKLAYLFNMSIYSAVQNKSISMSMDLRNSTGNWLDQGISLYPNYTARADFAHLFMRSNVAQIQSLLHTHGWLWVLRLHYSFFRSSTRWLRRKKQRLGTARWWNATSRWPVIEFMDVLCERWGFHNCMKHLNNHTWSRGTPALQLKRGAAICWGPMRGTAARVSFN